MRSILSIVSNTAQGVIAVDKEHQILYCSEPAKSILGISSQKVLGKCCYEVFRGRDKAGHLLCHRNCLPMRMAQHQELVQPFDMRIDSKNKQPIWLQINTILVPSEWRDTSIMILLFHDVSHQKEMEHKLLQLLSFVNGLSSLRDAGQSNDRQIPAGLANLTKRENEVLRFLAAGASTRAIAEKLCISSATVRNHIQSILGKLGAHNRLEAVTQALQSGLL
jgi:PAS domain S-box-containing protein